MVQSSQTLACFKAEILSNWTHKSAVPESKGKVGSQVQIVGFLPALVTGIFGF